MARNYRQFCALARALDVVGDRWSLLIVRELLLGPRRYGQLLDALQGIGTNLLADRLRAMQAEGLCARDGRVYSLTERGRRLEEAVLALARFGMSPMAAPLPGERMRPDWYAVAMLAAYRPAGARSESYEFVIDGETFHLVVSADGAAAHRGPAPDPAFRLEADIATFLRIATGAQDPGPAIAAGRPAAAKRWLDAFGLPQPVPELLQAG